MLRITPRGGAIGLTGIWAISCATPTPGPCDALWSAVVEWDSASKKVYEERTSGPIILRDATDFLEYKHLIAPLPETANLIEMYRDTACDRKRDFTARAIVHNPYELYLLNDLSDFPQPGSSLPMSGYGESPSEISGGLREGS